MPASVKMATRPGKETSIISVWLAGVKAPLHTACTSRHFTALNTLELLGFVALPTVLIYFTIVEEDVSFSFFSAPPSKI